MKRMVALLLVMALMLADAAVLAEELVPEGAAELGIQQLDIETQTAATSAADGEAPSAEEAAARNSDIRLNTETLKLGVSEKFQLTPKVEGSDATAFTFVSSNPKIAAVNQDGVVAGKKAGNTTIIVIAGDVQAECAVTVVKAPTKVKLSVSKITLGVGQTDVLKAILNNGNESAVSFVSSDSSVAAVDEMGVITAMGVGKAKITAKAYNGKKATCAVTVLSAPQQIRLSAESLTLPAGMSISLKASVDEGAMAGCRFVSSDERVATVNAEGRVTAEGAGTAVITATTYDGIAAECAVSVTAAPAELNLNVEQASLGVKETLQLVPTNDQNCEGGYTYASSNKKIAVVDQNGLVTAKKTGSATIRVTSYNGLTIDCAITVGKTPGKVALSEKQLHMGVGQTQKLSAVLSAGSVSAITFRSSDPEVAVVDADGVVTALAPGKAKITAATYNGKTAACQVTVFAAPVSIRLSQSEATLPQGMQLDLSPAGNTGSYAAFSCVSSDETVAVVDNNGIVTAVGVGSAIITVNSYNGLAAACEIVVTEAPSQVSLNEEAVTLGAKESFQLAVSTDFDGDAGIRYESSKPAVAAVDGSGRITAKKPGVTTVTAVAFNGVTARCVVTVKKAPSFIRFAGKEASLFVGQQMQLKWSLSAGSAGAVRFESDSDCVIVDDNGLVRAVSAGEAKITATTYNGKKTTCKITVKSTDYAIHALRWENGSIVANVSTVDACVLHVDVLSEAEKKLFAVTAEAAEALDRADVKALPEKNMPQYFILRAELRDAKGKALSETYVTRRYTSAYQKFEDQQMSDFESDRVIDFGTAGYGVLVDGVIPVSGNVTTSGKAHTFRSGQNIVPGSILLIHGEPMKVDTVVENADGSITVTEDSNVFLSDFYQVLKLDGSMDVGSAVSGRGAQLMAEIDFDESKPLVNMEETKTYGPVTLEAGATAVLNVRAVYDVKIFGKDYFEFETTVNGGGFAGITIAGATEKSFEVELFDGSVPLGATGLDVEMNIAVPLTLTAEATGHAEASFTYNVGFEYDPVDGFSPIKEKFVDAYAEIEGGFSIECGPQITLGIEAVEMITAEVNGHVGAILTGELVGLTTADPTKGDPASYHACRTCVDMTLNAFARADGELSYEITEDLSGTLASLSILDAEWLLGDAYLSVLNEAISVHGGKIVFGWGECPNSRYRTRIRTLEMDGKVVNGNPVTVSGLEPGSGTSALQLYLYPGDYTAAAAFKDQLVERAFTVKDAASVVDVQLRPVIINCIVTDSETGKPISGAGITVIDPAGKGKTGRTGSAGKFTFRDMLPGKYSFSISVDGYEGASVTDVSYAPGTENTLSVALKPREKGVVLSADLWKGDKNKLLLPESGVLTDEMPRITVSFSANFNGGSLTINHEHCSKAFTFKSDAPYLMSATVDCLPTEFGDTILISIAHQGTGMYSDVIVVQVVDGVMKKIWQNDNLKIKVDGKFSDQMNFSGTIQPSGAKFSGKMHEEERLDASYMKLKGQKLWETSDHMYYVEDNGKFSLNYQTVVKCVTNWYIVGVSNTSFVIGEGKLTMGKQWLSSSHATVQNR